MAVAISHSSSLKNPKTNNNISTHNNTNNFSRSFSPNFSSLYQTKFLDNCSLSTGSTRVRRPVPVCLSGLNRPSHGHRHSYDVVVVGAGIIGLSIARQLLVGSDLSVALVDSAVPCSGATGAGQGYIWMVHKTPGSEKWELAMRSRELWEMFAESVHSKGMDPLEMLGWKKTGSLLVGRTSDEMVVLKKTVEQLSEAGLNAKILSSNDLMEIEPSLVIGDEGGAAFLPDDYQLDANRTVAHIEKSNREFSAEGRYGEYYHEPVTGLLRSHSNRMVEAVKTFKNTLFCKKAVVIAAGCWTGSLMHDLLRDSDVELDIPVRPRKGHLLVVENFNSLVVNHGIMEVGYVGHQSVTPSSSTSDSKADPDAQSLSISMTATMDCSGNLVLGSSRQFVGFDTQMDEYIIDRVWRRAGEFFPILSDFSVRDFGKTRKVRVGLRPYMPDGKPVISPVPGFSNVYTAAGHEGEGLSLALGTAEMVADMVLGNPGKVDSAPFAVHGRF